MKKLLERKNALKAEADALSAKDADGTITAEELARFAEILDKDLPANAAAIAREERMMDLRREEPAAAVVVAAEPARVPAQVKKDPEKFASFGDQLFAIAQAGINHGQGQDRRLVFQAASGASEAVPSEGGFLVQQDFATDMLNLMHETGDLIGRVRRIPISAKSNGIKLPTIDETSRVNGSRWGGVQAYWANEGATVTATKPKFSEINLQLNKLLALGYATDELLADSTALEAVFRTAFAEELVFKTEDGIINGTGAGQMLGVLNSGALVTITPQSPQSANVLLTQDILNMWARMPGRMRKNAVWLINQDVEPQLYQLTLGTGTAVVLLYRPATDGSASGTLLGRPVIPCEYCATLGTVGDIILMDPMSYLTIDKGGVQQDSSMHVRFIYDEMTFRFIYRIDGQPAWKSAVTPFKGSNTLSPYVVLGTR